MLADTAIVPSVLGAVILLALFGIVIVRNERVLRYWLDISEFSFSYFSFYIPLLENCGRLLKIASIWKGLE